MSQRSLETIMQPDGRLNLPHAELPDHPVRVRVTFLESEDDASLADPGDYLVQLTDYEERLARGEIRWQ